jgi:mannose-1-phosphate guanylyltransferase
MTCQAESPVRRLTSQICPMAHERDWDVHNGRRWAVILAGGNGTRLRSLTRVLAGDERPKQFCSVIGKETLLDQTMLRIGGLIPAERTRVVVTRGHERFFGSQFSESTAALIVQPENRGTAPAILYSLLSLAKTEPDALVAFLPSDHYFARDAIFLDGVAAAFRAIAQRPDLVVLLGIVPDRPEVEYGWIEPDESIAGLVDVSLFRVGAFWEKPALRTAQSLFERGCLWNSFITIGSVAALLHLLRSSMPELYRSFEAILPAVGTLAEIVTMRQLYSKLPSGDFSGQVLRACPKELTVLPLADAGWVDVGSTDRAMAVRRTGISTDDSIATPRSVKA